MTESPLALQMAARVEKIDPPTTVDVCAAAARSVITLLEDPRSGDGGEWHEAVSAWNGARIRKIMRRGRGAAWQRAEDLAGVTVAVGSAQVRAFVPGPMSDAPRDLAKLQIQSSALDDPDRVDSFEQPEADWLVIAVTPSVEMSWGKAAAQCAHAGQRAWETAPAEQLTRWSDEGRPIRIVFASKTLWPELRVRAVVEIHDGGFTEIPAGTLTAIAFWSVAD